MTRPSSLWGFVRYSYSLVRPKGLEKTEAAAEKREINGGCGFSATSLERRRRGGGGPTPTHSRRRRHRTALKYLRRG